MNEDSVEEGWKKLVELDRDNQHVCQVSRSTADAVNGSLLSVGGVCPWCQAGNRSTERSFNSMAVTKVDSVVDLDNFHCEKKVSREVSGGNLADDRH